MHRPTRSFTIVSTWDFVVSDGNQGSSGATETELMIDVAHDISSGNLFGDLACSARRKR